MGVFVEQMEQVEAWVLWLLLAGLYLGDGGRFLCGIIGFFAILAMV